MGNGLPDPLQLARHDPHLPNHEPARRRCHARFHAPRPGGRWTVGRKRLFPLRQHTCHEGICGRGQAGAGARVCREQDQQIQGDLLAALFGRDVQVAGRSGVAGRIGKGGPCRLRRAKGDGHCRRLLWVRRIFQGC